MTDNPLGELVDPMDRWDLPAARAGTRLIDNLCTVAELRDFFRVIDFTSLDVSLWGLEKSMIDST